MLKVGLVVVRLQCVRIARIIGYGCCAILLILSLQWWGYLHPSDWTLRLRFKRQRAELERIVAMSDEDSQMSRIASDFLWTRDSAAWPRPESKWGITKKRWDEYREIFRRAHFDAGASRGENDVMVIVWSSGIVAGGGSISYLHCGANSSKDSEPREPACVERNESGRGHYGNSTSNVYRYKKIRNDWYILEQFW